jgi:alpha-amylase
MGNDLDYSQPDVRNDAMQWGIWITQRLGLAGFRLDAVKHFSSSFLRAWIAHIDAASSNGSEAPKLLMIGEYWRGDLPPLGAILRKFEGRLRLFDVPLASNMSKLSLEKEKGDLRTLMHNSLLKHYPGQAVVCIFNHFHEG